MPKPPRKTPGKVQKGLRVFKGTFFVAINEQELLEDGDRDVPIEMAELIDWLAEAISVDVNLEECGDIGFQALELHYDTLTEMSKEEKGVYYGK